jgi:hypothetical protein
VHVDQRGLLPGQLRQVSDFDFHPHSDPQTLET